MRKLISFFKTKKQNPKMETKEKKLEDLVLHYKGMSFEWIKGDLSGSVNRFKEVKKEGENFFIEFMEGGRINVDLVEEYTLYSPYADSPISSPPILSPEKSSSVTSIIYGEPNPSSNPDSPIYTLLKKQKKNMVEVSINIKLNLPSKELYGVLSTSFDDAENEIINFVLDGVDIEDIKKSLSESIKKNYYSAPEKSPLKKINKEKEINE